VAQSIQRGTAFAKTTRPVIGSSVRREALFTRLDGMPGRTVAWIFGPPGSGKSTLAASYVEARNLQCVWYQIDPDDADVATFFHYLQHAARRLDAHRGRELPQFSAHQSTDTAAFARKFFRALFARARAPAVVVFDNLPEVGPDSQLLQAIEAGLAAIPRHCCVIVTSRGDPPPGLARMQASGELVSVGGAELRIAASELVEIARLRGMPLDPEMAKRLEQRTQGWVAGIVLMLEHAKLTGSLAELPEDATPPVVFDYLAGEIFDRFEAPTRQFLARVAWLPRVSAEVAEILTGDDRGGRLLRNLAHNDYFVREVRSEEGLIYHIHPLLHDFLRERHAQNPPDPAAPVRLKQAAAFLQAAGQSEDAVALLAECSDWEGIANIAATEAPDMLAQGRAEALQRWIELLPKALLEQDARLLYASGLSLIATSPRAARRLLERAFEIFSAGHDQVAMAASARAIVDAVLTEFDDLAALDPWIAHLEALLCDPIGNTPDADDAATLATLLRATLARVPAHAALSGWLNRADRVTRILRDDKGTSSQLALSRLLASLARGEITRIAGGLDTSDCAAGTSDPGSALLSARALQCLLDGKHRSALEIADRGLAVAAADGMRTYALWLNVTAALAALGMADGASARTRIQAAETAAAPLRRGDRSVLHWLRSQLAVLERDSATAHREVKSAFALAVETGVPWLEFLAQIGLVQVLSNAGERHAAEALLRSATALAETLSCPLLGLALGMTRAAVAQKSGDIVAATAALRNALALGRSHGLTYVPALSQGSVAELCAVALGASIEQDYVRSLIRASNLAPPASALRLRQWPWRFQVRTLGGFAILRDAAPIEFSSKGPGRPVELLKVLIALGAKNVRTEQIADALWPRVDADYAHKSFTIALHRLRRMLEDENALLLRDGRLSLNAARFQVDTWVLDQLIDALDDVLRDPSAHAQGVFRRHFDAALAVYLGPFLPDESEQASFIACREQLRARIARALTRNVRRAADPHTLEAAEECYLRLIDTDPLCEAFHRGLMQCYQRRNDRVEAIATFERLRTLLTTRLGSSPSPETQAAYAELLKLS